MATVATMLTLGVVVPLSGSEFKLLRVFLAHPNRVLSRDQLIDLMISRDAGHYLHWTPDSRRVYWAWGPELFRPLRCFAL